MIDDSGLPRYGIYAEPTESVAYRDFDYRTPMGRRRSAIEKWVAFKQFQYVGVISPEIVAGCAIVNLRYLAGAFVYAFLPQTGELVEYSYKAPLSIGCEMSTEPTSGVTTFRQPGVSIEMSTRPEGRTTSLAVALRDGFTVDATFSESDPPFDPMVLCTQTGYRGWVYAQKVAGVPVQGQISGAFGDYDLSAVDAFAHYDFSAGVMRRQTFWNWACLSGRTRSGDRVGLNVSCGVNETSFSENCYWIDGQLHKVGLATFQFDRDNLLEPWRVRTTDGAVDLSFTPEGERQEVLNLGLVATNFRQLFGRFSGTLKPGSGTKTVTIEDMYGFVEDQFAKW